MRIFISIIALTLCALTADAQTFLGNLRQDQQGKGHVTVSQSADIDALVNGTAQQKQTVTPQKQSVTTQKQSTTQTTQTTTVQQPKHIQLVSPTQTKSENNSSKENTTHPQTTKPATQQQTTKPATQQQTTKPATVQQVEKPATQQTEKPAAKEHEAAPAQKEKERISTPKEEEETTTVVDTRKKMMSRSYKMQGYRIQVFSGGNSRKDRQKAENAGTKMKQYFPSEPVYVHFYSPSWKCRMGNYKSVYEARKILAQVKKLGYTQACIVKGPISVQY